MVPKSFILSQKRSAWERDCAPIACPDAGRPYELAPAKQKQTGTSRERRFKIMTTFADFGFAEPILKAIAAEGYEHPTPIQNQAIPPAMQSLDILGLAQTGTGKTAAFALPLLHHMSERRSHPGARGCRALIICPTRELAGQIADSFRTYGKFLGLSGAVVYGGANIRKQIRSMERGVDVLIATPGRLIDLMKQRAIRLDKVEHLVLDEADQMLDMGFIKPIRLIVGEMPKSRQTMLFSATMPKEIASLAEELLTDPKRIQVAALSSPAERVEQKLIMAPQLNKQGLLEALCADSAVTRAMIFVRTKHGADKVLDKLEKAGFSADAVHGNKSQNFRERALEDFRRGNIRLLVCTDVAARGIDVDGVSHVFNFDLPDVPEAYVHRIGRTARAGAEGISISFCAPHERDNLRQIERLLKMTIGKMEHPAAKAIVAKPVSAPQPGFEAQGDDDGEVIVDVEGFVSRDQGRPQGRGGRPQGRDDRPQQRGDSNRGGFGNRGGARSFGDRPTSDRPRSDRPQVDRSSYGDRPSYSERPRAGGPFAIGEGGERPRAAPRGDTRGENRGPRTDAPRFDKPRYESRSEGFGHRNGEVKRGSRPEARSGEAVRSEPRGENRSGPKPMGGKSFGGKPPSLGRSGARTQGAGGAGKGYVARKGR
jgi:ATP-dependent RNA helicase RhlE